MKTIIAGPRDLLPDFDDYRFREEYYRRLEQLDEAVKESGFVITEGVSGGARGADWLGENWCVLNGISYRVFPADWDKNGRSAGPIRNRQMADYVVPDGQVLLLWDGNSRGTGNMKTTAEKLGLRLYVYTIELVDYGTVQREASFVRL